jgi:hypothetical protein
MERRYDGNALWQSLHLRQTLLNLSAEFSSADVKSGILRFEGVLENYQKLLASVDGVPEKNWIRVASHCVEVCASLCRWLDAVLDAVPGADRHLHAAVARVGIVRVLLKEPSASRNIVSRIEQWLDTIPGTSIDQVGAIVRSFCILPQPVFYSVEHDPFKKLRDPSATIEAGRRKTAALVLKSLVLVDGVLIVRPHVIRSGTQYDLKIGIEIAEWPANVDLLDLDWVSSMDRANYSIAGGSIAHVVGRKSYEVNGHLIVYRPQSSLSAPAVFKLRARFRSHDLTVTHDCHVIGSSEVRVRAMDVSQSTALSTFPVVDLQIVEIMREIRRDFVFLPIDDVDDFQRCLVAVSRYASEVQQSGRFKGVKVDEVKDFQHDMLKQLRMTELGYEVKEGERVGGGVLDLKYRNIVIELKVEREIKDRSELRRKYIGQPAQYSASGMPLSVVCVLDVTEKDCPPANVANNITLETPELHGFESTDLKYPARVAVVVVDANLRIPSSYSR